MNVDVQYSFIEIFNTETHDASPVGTLEVVIKPTTMPPAVI